MQYTDDNAEAEGRADGLSNSPLRVRNRERERERTREKGGWGVGGGR